GANRIGLRLTNGSPSGAPSARPGLVKSGVLRDRPTSRPVANASSAQRSPTRWPTGCETIVNATTRSGGSTPRVEPTAVETSSIAEGLMTSRALARVYSTTPAAGVAAVQDPLSGDVADDGGRRHVSSSVPAAGSANGVSDSCAIAVARSATSTDGGALRRSMNAQLAHDVTTMPPPDDWTSGGGMVVTSCASCAFMLR